MRCKKSKWKEYSKGYRKENPIRYLVNQARYRCKKNNTEFNITLEDLDVPDNCPVFGIPLYYSKGKRTSNSYSLDRIDNTKGYVKGNVRIISFLANQRKGDMTLQQVESLVRYMKKEV